LDLLLYGQEVIQGPDMVIPHPAFHKRRFVLVPLHEIAPYVIHPAFGVSVRGLMDRLEDDHKVELMKGSE
jgi:7,8-dihydro-6-hydroxymethylpterin-pyrophosphokinase